MKDDRVYLLHIQDSLANIREYTDSGREFFFKDRKTQDAVVRNLEIIGEAVKHLIAFLDHVASFHPVEANCGNAGHTHS